MGLLGDFFGSLFGVGYLGAKLLQESAERAQDKEDTELCRAFREKYTDSALEAKLAAQVRDPSQYNAVWERIEEYKRTHTRRTVWFPVELIDVSSRPDILEKRMDGDPFYEKYFSFGWEDIGTKRISLQDFYRSRDENDRKYIDTMKWLMFTYEKLPKRNAEGTITTMNTNKDLIKHLRENRYKYGIDRESVEVYDDTLIGAFRRKYTDPALEAQLREQIKDPSQHDAIWSRIEEYRQTHNRMTVWFPVEIFDPECSSLEAYKQREKSALPELHEQLNYGWEDIGKRLPLPSGKRIRGDMLYNAWNALKWLMFTYEKFPKTVADNEIKWSNQKLVEYLRKNRDKYGI